MKTIVLTLLLVSAAFSQGLPWASSANSNSGGTEMNAKINWQTSAGLPTALNGTSGRDLATDTTNSNLYFCSSTGTPCATWTGLAKTGTDINTSGQVTAVHLSSALGVVFGGIGLSSVTAHGLLVGNGIGAMVVLPVATGVLHGGSGVDPSYGTVATADVAANAITSAKLAVVNTRLVCTLIIGADNGATLTTADIAPQGRQCYIPFAAHVVEIMVSADAGTPAVVLAKNHGGTLTDLSASLATGSSGALDCANPAGSGTGFDGATACTVALTGGVPVALAAGDWIEPHTSATASTAKRMSIAVTYVVD